MDWPRPPEKGDRAWERSQRGANRGRAARPHDRGARRRNQVLESAKVEMRGPSEGTGAISHRICFGRSDRRSQRTSGANCSTGHDVRRNL